MSNGFTGSDTKSLSEYVREIESFRETDPGQKVKGGGEYQDRHTDNILATPPRDERASGVLDRLEDMIQGKPLKPEPKGPQNMEARLKRLEKMGDVKETTTVAVMHDGRLLMGKRRDNGKWTMPGGGMKAGENPVNGACRELYEEAGVRCKDLNHLTSEEVEGRTGRKVMVHCYKCEFKNEPYTHSMMDPDNEVEKWEWVDVRMGLPDEVKANLHSPKNVLLRCMGLMEGDNVEVPPALTDPGLV